MEITGMSESKNISKTKEFKRDKGLNVKEKVKEDNSRGNVIDEIKDSNENLTIDNRRFEFSIHKETKDIMIKVIDSDTDEVIREVPPEKILDMVAEFMQMAGLLVDKRA
ncbi:MAG: flagellar protein FlaG [Firmicutes bacterium]|nr:flagellar protein FlaG [Bacillota bacterium]